MTPVVMSNIFKKSPRRPLDSSANAFGTSFRLCFLQFFAQVFDYAQRQEIFSKRFFFPVQFGEKHHNNPKTFVGWPSAHI